MSEWLQIIQLVAFLVFIPIYNALKGLDKSIADLRVELHRDFARKRNRS